MDNIVNIVEFLKTDFFIEHLKWRVLKHLREFFCVEILRG